MEKNDKPLISIVVPVYGIEEYIGDCVASIVRQTYTKLEIILVDDKSVDNSGKICDIWAKKDQRIKVVHKLKNEGLNMARFSGWESSTGELIAFVDGDDLIDEKYIEALYTNMNIGHADIAATGYLFFQHDQKPIRVPRDNARHKVFSHSEIIKHHATRQEYIPKFRGNLTTVHCKLYKRSIIEKVDWVKSNYSIGEDDFFSLMCYANSQKVVLVYDQLYFYRISPNSISRSHELNVKYNGDAISIFTLVDNYKKLSSELLGNTFFNETYYRTYVLYMYYINLLLQKGAWSDADFISLQKHMSQDIKNILKIEKYKVNKGLMEKVKKGGVVLFFVDAIYNRDQEIHNLNQEVSRLSEQLIDFDKQLTGLNAELQSHLGIKRSVRLLAGNIKRRATKKN